MGACCGCWERRPQDLQNDSQNDSQKPGKYHCIECKKMVEYGPTHDGYNCKEFERRPRPQGQTFQENNGLLSDVHMSSGSKND